MREIFYKGFSRVIGSSINREVVRMMDQKTAENGPQAGIKVLFSGKNSPECIWDGNKDRTEKILSNPDKAVMLVCNHPKAIEPLVFYSSLPPRKNSSIIGRNGVENFLGTTMKNHYIPVYHDIFLETRNHKQKRQAKNQEQMNEAIRRIKANESILIAPDGGRDRGNNKWKKGSALLLEAALEMNEAYLVMGYVPKSQFFERTHLFFQHDLKRTVKISEVIHVHDLPIPQEIKKLPHNDKRKLMEISRIMENYYENWAGISQSQRYEPPQITEAA